MEDSSKRDDRVATGKSIESELVYRAWGVEVGSRYFSLALEIGIPLVIGGLIALTIRMYWRSFEMQLHLGPQTESLAWVNPVENSLRPPDGSESDKWVMARPLPMWSFASIISENPSLAGFQPGRSRLRLGDTVYWGRYGSYLFAAVYEDGLAFYSGSPAMPAPNATPEPAPVESPTPRASWNLHRPIDPRLRTVGYAEPQAAGKQMNPGPASEPTPLPSGTPPFEGKVAHRHKHKKAALTPAPGSAQTIQSPAPEVRTSTPPATTATTREIIISATMTALLQADAHKAVEVVFAPLGRVSGGLFENETEVAIMQGVNAVSSHLSSVERVRTLAGTFPVLGMSPTPGGFVSREAIEGLISTPLPFPGGSALIEPSIVTGTDDWVNEIYAVDEHSTYKPAIVFLVIGFFALLIGRRRYPVGAERVTLRGLVDGAAVTAGLFITLAILWHFWRWWPSVWAASEQGLVCVALAAGAVEGGFLAALHKAPALVEIRDEGTLRSVLYRDTPVDEIARDRLGFAPLVVALRRFLNNPDTSAPVVLSINGPWGSGKSSVMKMLSRELQRTGRFRIVWFNAWQYHHEEQILAAFLQKIARELSEQLGPVFTLKLGLARFKHAGLAWQTSVLGLVAGVIALAFHSSFRHALMEIPTQAPGSNLYTKLLGLLLGGGLASALKPFRVQFARLLEAVTPSRPVRSIDEFTREFGLYREAIGDRKFLFLIDDLDRCQPDRVVDVLKAVNLIITSANEASNSSFFVLGYDQRYISDAVELHFHELIEAAKKNGQSDNGERFSTHYLKKMVTLSLSVPKVTQGQVQSLIEQIDEEQSHVPDSSHSLAALARRIQKAVTEPTFLRPMAAFCVAAAVAVVLALPEAGRGKSAPFVSQPPTLAATPMPTPSPRYEALPLATPLAAPIAAVVFPTPNPPRELFGGPLFWLIPALLLLAGGAALYAANRPSLLEEAYRRQDKDSKEFVKAVSRCRQLLPTNPRDAIRMVNLMRIEYLVQADAKAPLRGHPLNERECVSFTVIEKRHPILFQPKFVDEKLVPGLGQAADLPHRGVPTLLSVLGELKFEDSARESLAADLARLASPDDDLAYIANPDKLQRYVDVNRFILESEA